LSIAFPLGHPVPSEDMQYFRALESDVPSPISVRKSEEVKMCTSVSSALLLATKSIGPSLLVLDRSADQESFGISELRQ
jgi:hypothetical protein